MDPEPEVQSSLAKLNHIYEVLEIGPHFPQSHLRDYVSTYIENHNHSEEFFTTLCEHKFMELMINQPNKPSSQTCYLENLNLLLVNTKLSSELVYFLSQNCLHEFLFGQSILGQGSDFIEYYIQLLKTILMKISEKEENHSLIKLFCNNRYPTFPILINSTLLASDSNQLVRVTAQQCVLILVGMINNLQLFVKYLSQMPMLTFFIKIANEYHNLEADHEGITKFIADLIFQLRHNSIPLLLLNNVVSNVIITQSLPHNHSLALQFLQNLTTSLYVHLRQGKPGEREKDQGSTMKSKKETSLHWSFPKAKKNVGQFGSMVERQSKDDILIICATYFRVLIKFMTNKYLNSCFLSNIIHLSSVGHPIQINKFPNLPAKEQWKVFMEYLPKKFDDQNQTKSEFLFGNDILDEIRLKMEEFNLGKDFVKLKESYLKKGNSNKNKESGNSSVFGYFFKKISNDYITSQWIKAVSDLSSINFQKGLLVSENFPQCLSLHNCAFISEFIFLKKGFKNGSIKLENLKLGQQSQFVEEDEINYNDIRNIWSFDERSTKSLERLTKSFIELINDGDKSLTISKVNVSPEYLYLIQLKEYLSETIEEHFDSAEEKNKKFLNDYHLWIKIARICSGLNVKLKEKAYCGMAKQLNRLHEKLQTLIFDQGFSQVIQYLSFKMKKSQNKGDKNQKYKPGPIFQDLCRFEVIQKIMNSTMKSLGRCYEGVWKEKRNSFEEQIFQVNYFGKNGCILSFNQLMHPPTIMMKIEIYEKIAYEQDVMNLEEIKQNIQLGSISETIRVSCPDAGQKIVHKFNECKNVIKEAATSAFFEYLSCSHEVLAKQSKILKPDRNALLYETPKP